MRTLVARFTTLLLASVLAGGCAPVPIVIAAAATGGYLAGKDERSLDQISTDGAITAAVKASLLRDPEVRALTIDVDTWESVVTLAGTVESEAERDRAARLASRVNGVKEVRVTLRIVPVTIEERR